jgi:hypothetical protein
MFKRIWESEFCERNGYDYRMYDKDLGKSSMKGREFRKDYAKLVDDIQYWDL